MKGRLSLNHREEWLALRRTVSTGDLGAIKRCRPAASRRQSGQALCTLCLRPGPSG